MAHIEDRWYKTVVVNGKSAQVPKPGYGNGMRYRVRYIAPEGKEKSESFPDKHKRQAQAFLAKIQADLLRGDYIDPDAGKMTFRRYCETWLKSSACNLNRRDVLEREFRLHAYPYFGGQPLAAIQPATIRGWIRQLDDKGLAPSYQRNIYIDTSSVFHAAVDDKLIPASPFSARTVRSPRYAPAKVTPWSTARLIAFREVIEDRYKLAVDLGSGCGLRQGEIFGVSPDDVSEDHRTLHVVRQVKMVRGQLVFAAPKGGRARDVPLPAAVWKRMGLHTQSYQPVAVTLPWDTPTGAPTTVRLFQTAVTGGAVKGSNFDRYTWRPAIVAAGIEVGRRNGMHVLRHTYASVLLDAGENIKALSLYLGHSDPGFTLRTYTHLLPASEGRTRRAIDRSFGDDQEGEDPEEYGDGLATA